MALKKINTAIPTIRYSSMLITANQKERKEIIKEFDSSLLVDVFEYLLLIEGREYIDIDNNTSHIVENKRLCDLIKSEIKNRL